jgi:DNA modification methylase
MSAVPNGRTDIIVTSPPYLNNFDYAEMTRMLLYFWNIAGSWGDITEKVRKKLIVNTTTALKGHRDRQHRYRETLPVKVREELDGLVEALRARRQVRAGKKEYDYLVYPYFSQMTQVLKECLRCLKPGAPIHVMVADAALYGVHISTPQLLTVVMREIGFSDAICELVRRRGHRWILKKREGSSQGLGEYHIVGHK